MHVDPHKKKFARHYTTSDPKIYRQHMCMKSSSDGQKDYRVVIIINVICTAQIRNRAMC